MEQRIIVALGGNAIQNKSESGSYKEQMKNTQEAMENLLGLLDDKNNKLLIITQTVNLFMKIIV